MLAVVVVLLVAVCLFVFYIEWRDRKNHLHPH